MQRASGLGIASLAIMLSAMPAHAAGADAQNTGSVTITVNIPPFAAGLAAQAEGAVGLWTMTDDQSTLMVKIPDSFASGENQVEAAIFTAAGTPFSLSVTNPGIEVAPAQVQISNGLVRRGFTLRNADVFAGSEGLREGAATLVIAGV
jgi:hypothetical protein